jgi:hypothetical protein
MALGAAAAGMWLHAGGSLLAALALYSLVATFFILASAVLAFLIGDRRADRRGERACGAVDSLHAAE